MSYIHPVVDRPNFILLTGLRARELKFNDDNRCTGVDVVDNSFGKTHALTARAEVILSAGAIDSPKLLMLSGIGPAAQLEEFGIPVRCRRHPPSGGKSGSSPPPKRAWTGRT